MKKFWTAVIGVSMMCGVMSFLFTTEATMQDNSLAEIVQGNMAEIMASNLALQNSQNEQVRQFAQQMVTDHTAVSTELQTLATSKSLTLPSAASEKQASEIQKLGARTGADFDRDYMKMMVKDHDRMAKLLSREAERNADADVKAFAAKTLPVVQGHLTMARSISDGLKGTTGGNSNRGTDTNRSGNTDMDANANTNANANNANADNTGFSNLRPNVNPDANATRNTNTNRGTNRNSNSNSNTNTNTNGNTNTNSNTNGNANNSNVNRM